MIVEKQLKQACQLCSRECSVVQRIANTMTKVLWAAQ